MENIYAGLTATQVNSRLQKEGYNALPSQKQRNIFAIFVSVLKEPMLLMLLGAGTIYFILGEPRDALMLLSFVIVVIGITFYQERKTERALEVLKNLSSPRALVIRNGQQFRIPGREVARDDIVVLREGDRVPADAAVLQASNLMVDESLLTGESAAVRKSVWDGKTIHTHPGGEDLPFIFSGTMITQGRAIARVFAIGVRTEMGKIGKSLQSIHEEDTLLQKETAIIVRNFAVIGVVLCMLVIVVYGLIRGNWINGLLSGLTLSMAILPEEFPVVLLVFLTLGAWRMSKRKVLTRKTAVIETLGATTVLCVDKTGTLTMNEMRMDGLMTDDVYYDLESHKGNLLPERYHGLIEYAYLASQKDPFDPLEKEIKSKIEGSFIESEHIHGDWTLIREYPLSKELLALSYVWESPDKKEYVIAAKGAPEAVADLCHLSNQEAKKLQANIKTMSEKGLRIIGVARALFKKGNLPKIQHDFAFEFIGLLGFSDPIRESVCNAVKECHTAGIRVIMITGDYPGTAQFIARKIGLQNSDRYITGDELRSLSTEDLRKRIRTTNIFARVVPEQKLHIVSALKANREIVAMTGDGVNDAPALKSAHIGIAMGERGTDVAREAADMVLLNDDFSSIVQADKMGRRIFDNLKKAMAYIVSVHIPIAGMSFLPVLFQLPVILYPAHIAFLELIIDPACSIVFESQKEETDIMQRPPRNLKEVLFDRSTFVFSLIQGITLLAVVFIMYVVALQKGFPENEVRSMTFSVIVFGNLFLIISNLSYKEHIFDILKERNKSLLYVLISAVFALFIVLYVPFFQDLFHFALLRTKEVLIAFAGAFFSLIWLEGFKLVYNRINRQLSYGTLVKNRR